MAIQDKKLIFSDEQAETTQAAHDSDDVIDLGAGIDEFDAARVANYGEKGVIWLNVKVGALFTSAGAATLTVALHDSANDSSFAITEIVRTTIALGTLVAGYSIIRVPLPTTLRRYIKMVYTIADADMTAGSLNAWLSYGPGSDTPA